MKEANAPSVNDLKSGIGVGEAQVFNFDRLNNRADDIADKSIEITNKKNEAKKKEIDALYKPISTKGMHPEHIPPILKDIENVRKNLDVNKFQTDPMYKAQILQKFEDIRGGVATSVQDQTTYNTAMDYWNKNQGVVEKPTFNFDEKAHQAGIYNDFQGTEYGREVFTESETFADKVTRIRESMTTSGNAKLDKDGNIIGIKNTQLFKKDADALFSAEFNSKQKQDDYMYNLRQNDWNEFHRINSLKSEGGTAYQDAVKAHMRSVFDSFLPQNFQSEKTIEQEDVRKTGGSTKKEKEQYIARYENVTNALAGYTKAKQEFKGAFNKDTNTILKDFYFDEDKNAYVVTEAKPIEGTSSEPTQTEGKKGLSFKSEQKTSREVNAEEMEILLNQYGNQLEDQNFGSWEVVKSMYDKWGDESRIDQGGADNKVESVTTYNPYAQPAMENGEPKLTPEGNPITSYGADTHAFALINAANGIGKDESANKLLMEGGEYIVSKETGEKAKIDGWNSRYDFSEKNKKNGYSMKFDEAEWWEQDHEPIVEYYNQNEPMKYTDINGNRVDAVFNFDDENVFANFENFTQQHGSKMNIANRKEKKVKQHIRFNKPSQITKDYFPAGKGKKVTSDSKIQRGVELTNGNGEVFIVTKNGVVKWINN